MKKPLIIIVIVTIVLVCFSLAFVGNICFKANIQNNEINALFNINNESPLVEKNAFREKSVINGLNLLLSSQKTYNNFVAVLFEYENENHIDELLKKNHYSSNISTQELMQFNSSINKYLKKYSLEWISPILNEEYHLYIKYDCCDPATTKSTTYYYCLKSQNKAILIYDQSFLKL